MGRTRSMKVRVTRPERVTDGYTIIPNELARGEDEWDDLTIAERGLLVAGLTCADGWEASMEQVEKWLKDLGRDRQEAVRRGLREKGFMTLRQHRIVDGPDRGMFEWHMSFHMHRLAEADRDKLPAKKAKVSKPANSMPGKPGHGEDQPVSAGDSTPGIAGHGTAGPGIGGPGNAGPAVQGDAPYIRRTKGEELNPPQPPIVSSEDTVVGKAKTGGDFSSTPTTPEDVRKTGIAAVVDKLFETAPVQKLAGEYRNWSREVVTDAITAAVEAGRGDAKFCGTALWHIAKGDYGKTVSARRLLEPGRWWPKPTAEPAYVPAQRDDSPMCELHPTFKAKGCGPCHADAKAAPTADDCGPVDPELAERGRRIDEALKRRRAVGAGVSGVLAVAKVASSAGV